MPAVVGRSKATYRHFRQNPDPGFQTLKKFWAFPTIVGLSSVPEFCQLLLKFEGSSNGRVVAQSGAIMRHIASVHVEQYKCEADVFIDEPSSGRRRLVVQYGNGYCGPDNLEKADNGRPQFITGIPAGMSEQEIINNWLLSPMRGPFPRWEMPARVYGSPTLV